MLRILPALLLAILLAACETAEPPLETATAETVPRSVEPAAAPSAADLCVPYDPSSLDAMDATARVAFLTERMKACREICEAAGTCATDMPALAMDFYRRARAQAELGRHGEAVADYSRSLAFDPRFVPAYAERAVSLLALKRYANALADVDAAVALSPQDPALRALRCQILMEMDDPPEPVTDCRKTS